ncbi:hypothetical protein Pan216_34510 [Planctomycetes bacterium Pan216]|uniref:Lipoprotein n=1 Tax=Kolteria novifilia TaxID=2527975 RepID=A0A518B6I2_9BACT|nr:hypothetical protein Pan216_34510 [Planctomycetes bacterium Pan216]
MKKLIRNTILGLVLATPLVSTVGCQTYQVGQVLPSPFMLWDDVQYFPKGPSFPLLNELNAQRAAENERLNQK